MTYCNGVLVIQLDSVFSMTLNNHYTSTKPNSVFFGFFSVVVQNLSRHLLSFMV